MNTVLKNSYDYLLTMKKNIILFLLHKMFFICSFAQGYGIGEKTIEYIDSIRNRPVKIELWYPTFETDQAGDRKTDLPFILPQTIRNASPAARKSPLIILSHGSAGNRFSLAWLAISLSKMGYIVAAPDHWGGTFDNMIPQYYIRYWERPLDISFVITKLLADTSVSSLFNPDRIAVVGFSFGGYTSLALAGADLDCTVLKRNSKTKEGKKEFYIPELGDLTKMIDTIPCNGIRQAFSDKRIKSFVALAPGLGLGYDSSKQVQNVSSPILIIAAGNDKIAPFNTNAEKYHALIPTSKLVFLDKKTGHYIFLNEGNDTLKKEARFFFKDKKTVSRKEIHNIIELEIISFFEQTLK